MTTEFNSAKMLTCDESPLHLRKARFGVSRCKIHQKHGRFRSQDTSSCALFGWKPVTWFFLRISSRVYPKRKKINEEKSGILLLRKEVIQGVSTTPLRFSPLSFIFLFQNCLQHKTHGKTTTAAEEKHKVNEFLCTFTEHNKWLWTQDQSVCVYNWGQPAGNLLPSLSPVLQSFTEAIIKVVKLGLLTNFF